MSIPYNSPSCNNVLLNINRPSRMTEENRNIMIKSLFNF